MIVSIHQPNFMPYPGFFNKIKSSDLFIIYDTAQFVKNRWDNRNQIRSQSSIRLTIPISRERSFLEFSETKLAEGRWRRRHLLTLLQCYQRSPFFDKYYPFFEHHYGKKQVFLDEFNTPIILYLLDQFGIHTKVTKASEIDYDKSKSSSEALVGMVKACDGTTYLSGPSGSDYLDHKIFLDSGIDLLVQEYEAKDYKQFHKPFIPNLSAVDLLFNMGPSSNEYI